MNDEGVVQPKSRSIREEITQPNPRFIHDNEGNHAEKQVNINSQSARLPSKAQDTTIGRPERSGHRQSPLATISTTSSFPQAPSRRSNSPWFDPSNQSEEEVVQPKPRFIPEEITQPNPRSIYVGEQMKHQIYNQITAHFLVPKDKIQQSVVLRELVIVNLFLLSLQQPLIHPNK